MKMLIVTMLCCISYFCKTTKNAELRTDSSKTYLFPLEWIGTYEGVLTLYGLGADTTQIAMKLTIGQPDASGYYPWILQYGDKDKRYYGVEVINAEKGHYRIDEYNSIKLDAYLRGNHFISRFEVGGSDLTFHYEKTKAGINILVYASDASEVSESGGEIIAKDTIPTVKAFPMRGFQQAFLKQVSK